VKMREQLAATEKEAAASKSKITSLQEEIGSIFALA